LAFGRTPKGGETVGKNEAPMLKKLGGGKEVVAYLDHQEKETKRNAKSKGSK